MYLAIQNFISIYWHKFFRSITLCWFICNTHNNLLCPHSYINYLSLTYCCLLAWYPEKMRLIKLFASPPPQLFNLLANLIQIWEREVKCPWHYVHWRFVKIGDLWKGKGPIKVLNRKWSWGCREKKGELKQKTCRWYEKSWHPWKREIGAKSKNLGEKGSFWPNVHSLNWFAWFSMISSSFIYMKKEREIIQPVMTKHLILKGPECFICQLSKSWKQNLTLFYLQESFLQFYTAFRVSNCF